MMKQARFMLCCAGVFLIYPTNQGWLFSLAGITAFANLFSGQMMCGLQGCQTPTDRLAKRDPISWLHYGTTLAGGLFCLIGAIKLG